MPITPPDWGRILTMLEVLSAELLVLEEIAERTGDEKLGAAAKSLRATMQGLEDSERTEG